MIYYDLISTLQVSLFFLLFLAITTEEIRYTENPAIAIISP